MCVCVCVCVSEDYWKVLIISGTYFGEPQPEVTDQTHAADDDDEIDTDSKQGDEMEAEQNEPRQQNKDENNGENTNNNADTDSEDDKFSKKHRNSSKYFVTPRPPTSMLVLEIYGDLGKTGLLPLTAEKPQDLLFEAGQADEFQVREYIFSQMWCDVSLEIYIFFYIINFN